MKKVVLAYFDKKIGAYNDPVFSPEFSDEDFIEQSRRMCASDKISPKIFDFQLYRLGTFDDKSGEMELFDKPIFICSFSDFEYMKEKQKNA